MFYSVQYVIQCLMLARITLITPTYMGLVVRNCQIFWIQDFQILMCCGSMKYQIMLQDLDFKYHAINALGHILRRLHVGESFILGGLSSVVFSVDSSHLRDIQAKPYTLCHFLILHLNRPNENNANCSTCRYLTHFVYERTNQHVQDCTLWLLLPDKKTTPPRKKQFITNQPKNLELLERFRLKKKH